MKHYLICYDIEDDKQRRLLFKCLKRYGTPVQKSVFEVSFPERKVKQQDIMLEQIKHITGNRGNVRFYNMTQDSVQKSWTLENDPVMQHPGAIVL